MTEVAVRNHFVPQGYLKAWSPDGNRIWVHELLVPHAKYPAWRNPSLRSVGAADHLYTSIIDPEGADAFERWLNREIEQPALGAIEKIRSGRRLTRVERQRLTSYILALDVRTPASFVKLTERWNETLPRLIDKTLGSIAGRATSAEMLSARADTKRNVSRFPLKVTITDAADAEGRKLLSTEITVGREVWLWTIRDLLERKGKELANSICWSVVHPYQAYQLFTSDQPVMRLAYFDANNFHFDGGWEQPRAEVIFPISPDMLLYTQLKVQHPREFDLPRETTKSFLGLLKKRAFRAIFARQPLESLAEYREVSPEKFAHEQQEWETFHDKQVAAEAATPFSRS